MTGTSASGRDLPPALARSPLPSALLDDEGRWDALNPAATRLLGDPPPPFATLVGDPDLTAILASDAAVTLPVRLPDGRRAEAVVTRWSGGAAGGALVQFLDRSEMDRLERRLGEAATTSERFVSRVSHDLNNPIGTAQGYAQLLQGETSLSEEARGFVERILSSAARATSSLVAIVDEVRSASRIEAPDEVDVAEVLDEVRDDLTDLLAGRGAVVEAAGPLPKLRIDRRDLRRALEALVRNAVQHHPGQARVAVSARPSAMGWMLDVDDDGPGIRPAERDAALGLGDRDASARSGGIGLSLTRLAIARHGGELRLGDSAVGGLRATLLVPQRRADDPEVPSA